MTQTHERLDKKILSKPNFQCDSNISFGTSISDTCNVTNSTSQVSQSHVVCLSDLPSSYYITCGFQKQPSLGGVAQERQLLNRHYCPWPSHRPLHCLHAPCTCMGTTTVACRVSSNTQWCKQHGRHGSTPAPSALQCGDSWSSGKCSTEANHCLLADQHGLDPDKHSLKPSPTNMKCWEWKLACPKQNQMQHNNGSTPEDFTRQNCF